MGKPVFSGVSAEAYRPAIEALLTQRKAVRVPFQGKSRSARCLYGRIKLALKWYKEHPELLPGLAEAYEAITVSPVEDVGCYLGLKGWIAGKPFNTRRLSFHVLDTPLEQSGITSADTGNP
jgi:hypothetical protein